MRKFALPLLLLAACGKPKISKDAAAVLVQKSAPFQTAKLLYLPRVLAIPSDGIMSSSATREGEALTITQIASVDPVVAVLRARDLVAIEDFVSAVQSSIVEPVKPPEDTAASSDSSKSPNDSLKALKEAAKHPRPRFDETHTSPPPVAPLAQAWVHTLRVTPRSPLQTAELVADDGDDNPESPRVNYSGRPIARTPGWTLATGAREFLRALDVGNYSPMRGQPPGEMTIDFVWRWRPTKPGAPFDTESAEFQSLPPELQQSANGGGITMDTSRPHMSRAYLARDGTGWKVTGIDWTFGDDKPIRP
ncbi:MAG TPA: hypothetical protein VJO33_13485 [Gemmatimonadaceae bacterium]|nr:hypothetical protein [Gemmatimonadaceae bacterium]